MESDQRSVVFERQVRSIVIDLLVLLADGDYESIMERCGYSLLNSDDLHTAVAEYGRTVIAPPADYAFLRACELRARAIPGATDPVDLRASVGLSEFADAATLDHAIARADQAMYRRKKPA